MNIIKGDHDLKKVGKHCSRASGVFYYSSVIEKILKLAVKIKEKDRICVDTFIEATFHYSMFSRNAVTKFTCDRNDNRS